MCVESRSDGQASGTEALNFYTHCIYISKRLDSIRVRLDWYLFCSSSEGI